MALLRAGDPFPRLELATGRSGQVELPEMLAGSFGVVLVYRGSWCPFCNAQLAAFNRALPKLAALDIEVVAFSVDDEPTTSTLISEHGLQFPVGHGADPLEIAEATGAFLSHDHGTYVNSTGFVLDRNGKVLTAVYSTGAIGRLVPADVIGLVGYVRSLG